MPYNPIDDPHRVAILEEANYTLGDSLAKAKLLIKQMATEATVLRKEKQDLADQYTALSDALDGLHGKRPSDLLRGEPIPSHKPVQGFHDPEGKALAQGGFAHHMTLQQHYFGLLVTGAGSVSFDTFLHLWALAGQMTEVGKA